MLKAGEAVLVDVVQHHAYEVKIKRRFWFAKTLGSILVPDSFKGRNFDLQTNIRKGLFFVILNRQILFQLKSVNEFTCFVNTPTADFGSKLINVAKFEKDQTLLEILSTNTKYKSIYLAEVVT